MKKQLLLIFFILFSINFISALGETITTSEELKENLIISESANQYPAIEIDSWFGMGGKLADLVLTEHTSSCGLNCLSEFVINTYEDSALIDDVKFYNTQGKETTINSYKFYIKDGIEWKDYIEGQIMPKGNYIIKLEGKKNPLKTIDWVMTSQGKKISEWALWTNSTTRIVENQSIAMATVGGIGGTEYSGVIIRPKYNITVSEVSLTYGVGASRILIYNSSSSKKGEANVINSRAVFNSPITLYEGISYSIIANNPEGMQQNCTSGPSLPIEGTYINWTHGNFNTVYSVDDTYFCNIRNITVDLDLSSVRLNSPDNNEIKQNPINFNCSVEMLGATNSNITLMINGKANETKSLTGTTNSTIFTKNMSNGVYNWTCKAIDSDNSIGYAVPNRTLTISEGGYFSLCNQDNNITFLNITFKDENTLENINVSVNPVNISYYFADSSQQSNYYFVNASENYNYAFCFKPANETLYSTNGFNIRYYSTGYPTRQAILSGTFTNSTTNQVLYLLGSSYGIYVTFQTITAALQPIEGVEVTGTSIVNGVESIVASGLTGGDGAITFWLNPEFAHTFTFSKNGYATLTKTITPTQSSYTVTLGGSEFVETDSTRGVGYIINPSQNFLNNNTNYNFNFTISSSYWALDNFGASLYYGNGTIIDSDTSTSSGGGTLSFNNINTLNVSSIYMLFNYTANSTTQTYSRTWYVQSTGDTDYSVFHFFNRFNTYVDQSLFGVDEFGKSIFAFLILILITGGLTYKYGIANEAAIMGIVFGLVFFFDYGLNFIPRIQIGNLVATEHFLTYITFMLMITFVIREEIR